MKKLVYVISYIIGAIIGIQLASWLISSGFVNSTIGKGTVYALSCILFGFIFLCFIPIVIKVTKMLFTKINVELKNTTMTQIIMIAFGLLIGLILSALLSLPIQKMNLAAWVTSTLTIVIYIMCCYMAVYITSYKTPDVERIIKGINPFETEHFKVRGAKKANKLPIGVAKILDTSVIIDGRVLDILRTGFIDGPIIIPDFVLFELQLIADSSDNIKRSRGRRGLDILNQIQDGLPLEVINVDNDYPDIKEVDTKLLKLAMDLDAKIVTNDYNLNKIAAFQGVEVLNTNELSNAVKTVVLPGEQIFVKVLKEGKEASQGIAYLEDGTMIVVEEGRNRIGEEIMTEVTSVLQTAAGRMIFVKPL